MISRIATWPLLLLIHFYRWVISPVIHMIAPGSGCRFVPTCSDYALQAVRTHGAFRGGLLTFKRIMRCHPWGGYGPDPVPLAEHKDCGCQRLAVDRKHSTH
ncbi:MAG: membrane protein insertion efficiency factor YidD [Verrucomicrobia bacterium]|nr:membrane protein insertion efficiency factor YidD [Verrucomicrobiota bacterium]